MEKIYILILNYNSAKESLALFYQLREFAFLNTKILVIDNFSFPSDRNLLTENIPGGNLILNNKNKGYAGGNNIGLKLALEDCADYMLILNPDIRLQKDSLSILLKSLKQDKNLAAIGPRIVKRENPILIFTDGELVIEDDSLQTIHQNHNKLIYDTKQKFNYAINYIDGSCILLNAKAVKEVGEFSEEFFLYFEETDWCFRAKQKGWDLAVNSNAVVYNLTSSKGRIFHYYMMRNKLIFCKKYFPHYQNVENFYLKSLIKEFLDRFRGIYFKPHYFSRCRGFLSGALKNLIH